MKSKIITLFTLLLISAAATVSAQQQSGVSVESLRSDLAMYVCKNDERLGSVKALFKKLGAGDENITIEKFGDIENLTVTKKGKTAETIIVGAHYDKVRAGCGVIDNWTGIVIIANLYAAIKNVDTAKTYIFTAFGSEETGLKGSHAMAGSISREDRPRYCSMINFDSFGFNYPQVLTNVSSPTMSKFAEGLAKEINMPFAEASLAGAASADSASFVASDIPAITFHGLTNNWQNYLHSSKDKIENVKVESVFVGYNFAYLFISRVDGGACEMFRKVSHKN
jgi:hypothetical protein